MYNDSAVPALFTFIHLALAMLRKHRAARGLLHPFVFPSLLFTPLPWIWASPIALAAGLSAHLAWLVFCEVVAPSPPPRAAAPRAPAPPTRSARKENPSGRAPAFATTPVLAVLDEAADIKTFRLARPAGFDFRAGQFVAVRLQIDGKPHVRCYSVSSSPDARGYLEISVRRQGLVSSTLHATVRSGSQLTINRPAGGFVYPEGDERPLALVAGGIGITPLLSMLRYATSSDPTRPVALLYSARREEDLAFLSELRVLAERFAQVRVGLTLTADTGATRFRQGRIDGAMIRQYVADPAHTIFCICGPSPMIAATTALLGEMGVPSSQIRFEQFETAVAAATLNSAASEATPAAGAHTRGEAVRVTFALSGCTAVAQASQSLLETAEAEGVAITSSCRSGVCQACRTRLTSGDADCRSDVLDPADRADGFVLPCVTWAAGDCVLEA